MGRERTTPLSTIDFTVMTFIMSIAGSVVLFISVHAISSALESFEGLEMPLFFKIAVNPVFHVSWVAILAACMVDVVVRHRRMVRIAAKLGEWQEASVAEGEAPPSQARPYERSRNTGTMALIMMASAAAFVFSGSIMNGLIEMRHVELDDAGVAVLPQISKFVYGAVPHFFDAGQLTLFFWMFIPIGFSMSRSFSRDNLEFKHGFLRAVLLAWLCVACLASVVVLAYLMSASLAPARHPEVMVPVHHLLLFGAMASAVLVPAKAYYLRRIACAARCVSKGESVPGGAHAIDRNLNLLFASMLVLSATALVATLVVAPVILPFRPLLIFDTNPVTHTMLDILILAEVALVFAMPVLVRIIRRKQRQD